MNDTLIILGIACMVIGCVLGYWSIRRYDGSPPQGPWISLVALLSLATLAAVGRDGGVDSIEQRVAGTESRVFAVVPARRLGIRDAEILERYGQIKQAKEGHGALSGLAARASNP